MNPRLCRLIEHPIYCLSSPKVRRKEALKLSSLGAGGAAHLPGMCASQTALPVIGVPVKSSILNGVDSLLSIVQMPAGIPVATVAIGDAGAKNAGLLAVSILGSAHPELRKKLHDFRSNQTETVLNSKLD